jgi:hypothetical protein
MRCRKRSARDGPRNAIAHVLDNLILRTTVVAVGLILNLLISAAYAGQADCRKYDDCLARLGDDAAAEARHRCQTGTRTEMLTCRGETSAAYRKRNNDRCESLLAACNRSDQDVTIHVHPY